MKRMLFLLFVLTGNVMSMRAGDWILTAKYSNDKTIFDFKEYELMKNENGRGYYYKSSEPLTPIWVFDGDGNAKSYAYDFRGKGFGEDYDHCTFSWEFDRNYFYGWDFGGEGTIVLNNSISKFRGDRYCFNGYHGSANKIEGLQNLNTKDVTDMSHMFDYCGGLTSLDLSNFDTRKVTTMLRMFGNCYSLTSLDLSSFDTRNVTDMTCMFSSCNSLTSLDLSSFDTRNVTDMSSMFNDCGIGYMYSDEVSDERLTSLDLSSFDTRNVTDMSGMFSGCRFLTSLDLSSFDTRNVTDMSYMFDYCGGLTSLDLSNFDTRNVTDMSGMFYDCSSLTSLDLSGFDTRNVTNMSDMFNDCSSITSLDLSGFDTRNVTNMSRMFSGCSSLTSLDLKNFEIPYYNSNKHSDMFFGCTGLDTLRISSSFNRLEESPCEGVGTKDDPCVIIAPDDFDFKTDTSGDWFFWKGGYFKLEDSKRYVTLRVTTDLGYVTYCSYEPLDFTNPWGVKAYIVSDYTDGVVTLSPMTTTPPQTGLLLKLGAGDYQFRFSEERDVCDNMLKGVLWDTYLNPTEGYYVNFVLADGNNGLGFYRLKGSGYLGAHHAYLRVPASAIANEAKFLKMRFDDEATAIDGIMIQEENVPYYDLQGNCYESKPTKQGIYIHNGKKVVVK